jgi:hypothetical protein
MLHFTTFYFHITKFPAFRGLYDTKESSFHLNEVLYNVSPQYALVFILFLLFHFWLLQPTTYCKVKISVTKICYPPQISTVVTPHVTKFYIQG